MAKDKAISSGSMLHELWQVGVYKRSQGRITRQITFGVFAAVVLFGAWRLYQFMIDTRDVYQYATFSGTLLVGLWLSYRAVNYPPFADFLISVEGELNKVSWPSRSELWKSALVVIIVIFSMAFLLYFYDFFWVFIFKKVLQII